MIKYQSGASLVFILVLTLVTTLIGTFAVKMSINSLNIATNSQIQTLLQQSSDSVLYKIQDSNFLRVYMTSTGILGFSKLNNNADKELVFCVRSNRSDFFDIDKSSVIYIDQPTKTIKNDLYGTEGYCKTSIFSYFTSARKSVLSQVYVKVESNSANTSPFQYMMIGTDTSNMPVEKNQLFKVTVISLLPNISDASNADIEGCLSGHMSLFSKVGNVSFESVSDCLSQLNVPFSTQSATFQYSAG